MGEKAACTHQQSLQASSSLKWRAIVSTSGPSLRRRIVKIAADVPAGATKEIGSVLAHPVFGQAYACSEHDADSATWDLGDAFGTDSLIQKLGKIDGRSWPRFYRGSGNRNEDWHGWQQTVLSPCTCEVVDMRVDTVTNSPGVMGTAPASIIKLKRADGAMFVVVNFDKPRVHVGEHIAEGQAIAQVGNNGLSRHPHIHIGAYRGTEPLQIRFDRHFIQLTAPVCHFINRRCNAERVGPSLFVVRHHFKEGGTPCASTCCCCWDWPSVRGRRLSKMI